MKRTITAIPHLYRNVRRWAEIIAVLSRYGLADWLSRLNIELVREWLTAAQGEVIADQPYVVRIRLAMTELGPTLIKFGQILSTRPDVVGAELADELSKLQSDAPADNFVFIRGELEEQFQRPLEEIFESFDETPLASASIGQVHAARLRPGSWAENGQPISEDVVVKVRHRGIEKKIETDLDILSGLAQLAERVDEFRNYQPTAIVAEMSRIMRNELLLERECRNLMQFRAMFASHKRLRIPRPFPKLCSAKVVTMERLVGTNLREAKTSLDSELLNVDLSKVARDGANLYLQMIFKYGFYHADPHPGNILVMPDGSIGLIDFGLVGRISESLREDVETMLVSIVNRDPTLLAAMVKRIGRCPIDLNESGLSNDLADFVGQYATQVLSTFDMSGALRDFVEIVRRYNIVLPSEASLLIKTLITLEGTAQHLDPDFSLMEVMRPFQRLLMMRRLSPSRQIRKAQRFYWQLERLVENLPDKLSNILEQVQTGRFDIHLDHRRLGPTVNRLVLGLMTSALFLGSALMLSYKVAPLLFPDPGWMGIKELSMFGVMGTLVSIVMGLRLFLAIRKSGNLDQRD
jgi:ubiquinone biosynthesis protein